MAYFFYFRVYSFLGLCSFEPSQSDFVLLCASWRTEPSPWLIVIIDDLMFMAMEKHEANLLFQFINKLYGQTSIIITSNKGPEGWGELLGDPAITTAILDRIVHKCEVIHLAGDCYRLKYRTSIFGIN